MAERMSGAVKPPTIELKAREAGEEATTPPREEKRPEPPRARPQLAMPWSAIGIAAVLGAALGTGATYGLAGLLPFPDTRPQIADPAPELASLGDEAASLGERLSSLEQQARNTQVSLDATLSQVDAGFAELRQGLADVRAASAPVDLLPLEAKISALEDRLAVTAAGAGGGDAAALAATLTETEAALATLRQSVATLEQRLAEQQTALATQSGELDTLKLGSGASGSGATSALVSPAVRLPLLVASLQEAVDNGRPYANELAAVTALLPDLAVPETVALASGTGLPRPDAVASQLSAAVPAILAGRPVGGSGDMGQDALEWVKGVLAIRPSGEVAGELPEALVSRLEAAVARRDFVAADAIIAALPPAMQAAAGALVGQVSALAAAESFVDAVRARALGSAT